MKDRARPAPEPLREPLPAARPATVETIELPEAAAHPVTEGRAHAGAEARILAPRTGYIVGLEGGQLQVDYPGNTKGPLPARSTVRMDAKTALEAAVSRRGAVLVFDDGDPRAPIVVGLLEPPITTLIDLVLEGSPSDAGEPDSHSATDANSHSAAAANSHSAADANSHSPATATATATADGKRVVVEGEEEVSLRCGEASITLRRDGRVVVRGAYVETHASGTNRIKGGSVRIN
ncbi:MAG: DUF6484 domain-containing protein [Polyangiaceae bacterium]